jgi:site-specific DNA-methyltransferase (adenine-specific)
MIHTGDCIEVMATLPAESVDAVVTDPPYDLLTTSRNGSRRLNNPDNPAGRSAKGFMGKTWDGTGVAFRVETWREAFRLLRPGGHLLAFGGTRTYHRLASAIEDAGFEIRDCLVWVYASGFPKSLDVSKAIDKAAGAERQTVAVAESWNRPNSLDGDSARMNASPGSYDVTAPATDAAKRWQGWGTALKPAWEPIVMARKPLVGTVAANVLAHGTGALNIDATRIPTSDDLGVQPASRAPNRILGKLDYNDGDEWTQNAAGRWPANLILTDPIFDGGVDGVVGGGSTEGGQFPTQTADSMFGIGGYRDPAGPRDTDAGTYSRFFLVPKSSRSDREPVLRGTLAVGDGNKWNAGGIGERRRQAGQNLRENLHPTVKPVELMRHLVRLVTPPGGTVLDCFLGSGTTAIACEQEGFAWIGIEKEPEYVAIAEARLNGTQRGLGLDVAASTGKRNKSKSHWPKERTPGKDGWGFGDARGSITRTRPHLHEQAALHRPQRCSPGGPRQYREDAGMSDPSAMPVVRQWMCLDVWLMLGRPTESFPAPVTAETFADLWAEMMHAIAELADNAP